MLTELSVSLYSSGVLKALANFIQKPVDKVLIKKAHLLVHDLGDDERTLDPIIKPIVLNIAFEQ